MESRTSWEDKGGDQRLNQTILYFRCPDDIILLLSARDKISNQLFKADLQKQQELLKVTQQASNPDLGVASAFDSNNGIAAVDALEPSTSKVIDDTDADSGLEILW